MKMGQELTVDVFQFVAILTSANNLDCPLLIICQKDCLPPNDCRCLCPEGQRYFVVGFHPFPLIHLNRIRPAE